jgi:hypothetical protein
MGSYVKAMPKLSADGLTVYSSSGEGCAATANTMFALSVNTGAIQWQVCRNPTIIRLCVIPCAGKARWKQQHLYPISVLLRP